MADDRGVNKVHAAARPAHKSKSKRSKKAKLAGDYGAETADSGSLEQEKIALQNELAQCQLEKRQAIYRFNAQASVLDDVKTERDSLQDEVRVLRKAEGDHHTLYINNAAAVTNLKLAGTQNAVLDATRKKMARANFAALGLATVITRTSQGSEQRFDKLKQLEADKQQLLKEASEKDLKVNEQALHISQYQYKLQQAFAEKQTAEEELAWVKACAKEKDQLLEDLKSENAHTEKMLKEQRALVHKQSTEIHKQSAETQKLQEWLNQLNSKSWVHEDGSVCDRKSEWRKRRGKETES
ncbi:hypothetical protein PRZ48_003081 [Zasmidium cellare]|uniref:Uncharacterized protein n=1 Tax=Zasmidium cellare TaxID=395010 RepID=A0ABR0EW99_ZASCE|nr:hypothetical protein PRZ48_003081 [Zasmidium cellare]